MQADYVRARLALVPLLAKDLRVPTAVADGGKDFRIVGARKRFDSQPGLTAR